MDALSKLKGLVNHSKANLQIQTSVNGTPRIINFDKYINTKKPRFALLSYLSHPVKDQLSGTKFIRFSNDGLATSWPKVLNQLGYIVDIINWDDRSFKFNKQYDLVVSHGAINFENISSQMSASTRYIYFSTGSYWKYHNAKEESRLNDFKRRHGISLPNDRLINYPEEEANYRADAIICLGNKAAADTYHKFANVYNLPIGSFTSKGHVKTADEIKKGRHNILFIAGSGNIHKGLDLVLDALAEMPEFNLHIYTFLDTPFVDFYQKQLAQPNIKIYDFEAFPSEKFLKITRNCNVAIMPSCSEGSPGSIVESMIQGLIPIVSIEAHIDIDKFGIMLENNTIESIKKAITRVYNMPIREQVSMSKLAKETGLKRHSKEMFERSLNKTLRKIEGSD